jgi:hypothetical protein
MTLAVAHNLDSFPVGLIEDAVILKAAFMKHDP